VSEHQRQENGREERLILDLLDGRGDEPAALAAPVAPAAPAADDEVESGLLREYVEVLGLLPRALAEVRPRAEVKERILEAIGHGAAPLHRPTGSPAALPRADWRKWLLPLAASIAVATLAVTGWLVIQVQDQRVRIAELSEELGNTRSLTAELAMSQGMLAEVRSRLAMVTAQGSQFCALRPPAGSPASGARGVVVMQAARNEWFLRIEGLEPCPQGRKYSVWFATEDGAVAGPIFAVKAGEAIELTVSGRPDKINAIMITLESEPAPSAPSMEPLLFGDERMQLL